MDVNLVKLVLLFLQREAPLTENNNNKAGMK